MAGALRNLIVVACHASFSNDVDVDVADIEDDASWVLAPFQRGEPPFFVEHIRRGAVLASHDPDALLLFSGGATHKDTKWTEADTYLAVARRHEWWLGEGSEAAARLGARASTEPYARDSFENLLYSLCKFHKETGGWPEIVTVVSWAFKSLRFDLHREALRWPRSRFRFDGCNEPFDLRGALAGEGKALAEFYRDTHGRSGDALRKRECLGNPAPPGIYDNVPGMTAFWAWMYFDGSVTPDARMPWESSPAPHVNGRREEISSTAAHPRATPVNATSD